MTTRRCGPGCRTSKIEAEERGDTVAVTVRDDGQNTCGEQNWQQRGRAWWDRRRYSTSTDLTLQVPRDVRVRLCTVNGGTLTVSDVTGDFDVSNVNGKVVLTDLGGSGSATTVNGDIDASFAAAPRAESRFKTVNGTIAATFPRNLSADLSLKTFNGGLFTDFDTTPLPTTAERVERPDRPQVRLPARRCHQSARRRGRSRADVRHAQWRRAHSARALKNGGQV